MASVKIIHYTHKENSDGTSPVIIQVIKDGSVKKKTIASVTEDQWNKDARRVKKHPNAGIINQNLSDEFNRIEKIILSGDFDLETIFKTDDPEISPSVSLTSYIETLIKNTVAGKRVKPKSGAKYAADTVKHYNSAFGIIKKFTAHLKADHLQFDDITLNFYYDFKEYAFKDLKLTDNYFGSVIKFLKTCMAEAKEERLHKSLDYSSKRFAKTSADVDNVYLDEQQLKILSEYDLSAKPRLDKARDLFLVGCWTGLRFSDFHNIKPKDIQGDFIEIKTQKTGEVVVIPIHPALKDIMEKYAGKTHNSLPPAISNDKLNAYIKDALEEAKFKDIVSLNKSRSGLEFVRSEALYKLVTTHTARRSFASNMFRMGVPTIVIMAITGHRTEKAFMKYIKVTPREKAEIMREIWNRKTMKAV